MTEPMYYILLALTEECCGVDIMEKGPADIRRRILFITDTGRQMLKDEYEKVENDD